MIGKCCPKCVQQVPVASKTCRCGHVFFTTKRTANYQLDAEDGGTQRRRTERVKRGKPNYYDALEFDKEIKKRVQSRGGTDSPQKKDGEDGRGSHLRKRRKKKKAEREEEEKEGPALNTMPDNGIKGAVILAEINRRIGSVSWSA
ncbi:UPF0547 protein C16orf87 homolog [Bacillus rossius redtenbacheri]|uniref:UPF0547 protein C16orf87 homolog n=1 Tax=Bacillus rossius redtenbacheri TaxID=93214 RepID=UPI002FDDC6F8